MQEIYPHVFRWGKSAVPRFSCFHSVRALLRVYDSDIETCLACYRRKIIGSVLPMSLFSRVDYVFYRKTAVIDLLLLGFNWGFTLELSDKCVRDRMSYRWKKQLHFSLSPGHQTNGITKDLCRISGDINCVKEITLFCGVLRGSELPAVISGKIETCYTILLCIS